MSDLTLREALEGYEAECREVLGIPMFWKIGTLGLFDERQAVIGACCQWLAGKDQNTEFKWDHSQDPDGFSWPTEPLRFVLEEVRTHMDSKE